MSNIFFRNSSLVLLILFSSISLWFPGKFNLFLFVISLLIIAKYLPKVTKDKEFKTFQYILFVYSFWIIFSSIMHYSAMNMLEPLTYITVKQHNVNWGLSTLKHITQVYLFFPLLFFIASYLFHLNHNVYKRLYLLPVIFIPSLVLAIYQGLVDIGFLNIPYFAKINQASGLGTDANGFGLSLFLLFPICILTILRVQDWWKRLFFILLTAILLWCLLLSGSRTGFLGVVFFAVILPWIWVWVSDSLSKMLRRLLIVSPLVFIILTGAVGVISFKGSFFPSSTLMKRLHTSYMDFEEGGIRRVMWKSARPYLWQQAYRLTMKSPISGWGPGGFYRNLDNIRFINNERGEFLDNANNHYLQMSSELGLLGASFNILFYIIPLWMVFRIRKRIQNREEKWTVGITFATASIMMLLFITGPHTMALDVLWIFAVFLAFLFVTAIKHGYSFRQIKAKLLSSSLAFLTILFVLGTYANTFGQNGYKARQQADWWPFKYEKNCYAVEKWKKGRVRWCRKGAFLQIPITQNLPEKIKLTFIVSHPDVHLKPVTVKYGGKGGVTHELVSKDNTWKTIEIRVTMDYIFEFAAPDKSVKKYFVVSFDVSRTYVPKKWGVNNDTRELGLAVLIPSL